MQRFLRFDSGFIGVTGDRKAAIDWYCKHMGLKLAWDSPGEQMTLLQFPGWAAIPLKQANYGVGVANLRLCFESPDLAATHAALTAEGVRTTPIYQGPGSIDSFDFYDLEGTRLTAVANPELAAEFPSARFVHYAPTRIGVSNLEAAIAWYQEHVGMIPARVLSKEAFMELGDGLPFWLEELPPESFTGKQVAFARPSFVTMDICEAHRYCQEQGFAPSEIDGSPNALQVFYIYDPDGNRLILSTYPHVKPLLKDYER